MFLFGLAFKESKLGKAKEGEVESLCQEALFVPLGETVTCLRPVERKHGFDIVVQEKLMQDVSA